MRLVRNIAYEDVIRQSSETRLVEVKPFSPMRNEFSPCGN